MPIPDNVEELTKLFASLGASEPELWATSQMDEGIPQVLRFMFLKQAWNYIVTEGDTAWIDEQIENAKKYPEEPYAGLGVALEHCLEHGADPKRLSEIARCLQAQMLFNLGYLLDGPAYSMSESLDDVAWGLFQVDEEGKPFGEQIGGLDESVLEMDPTGREMRPAKNV